MKKHRILAKNAARPFCGFHGQKAQRPHPPTSLALALALILFFSCLPRPALSFVNGNFETGDTSGWTVSYGGGSGQSVTVVTTGPAPNTNGNLNRVYGGVYSCELNSGTGPLSHGSWASISQSD